MTCRQLIEFLSDYHERTLPPEQRARFEAHLHVCSECRRYVDQFGKTIQLTRRLADGQESADLPQELVRAIVKACDRQV